MFRSPYTSPSLHDPYANMAPSDYSSPYDMGNPCPFSYEERPHIPPTRLPDLYYDYGLEASPSTSSSEIIPTPPLTLDFTESGFPRNLSNATIYYESAIGRGSTVQHRDSAKRQATLPQMPHPHEVNFPLTTCFVSPLDTLLGPSNNTPRPTPSSHSPPKLYQPRPSRRIPIVNLDKLASACETSHPSLQVGDHKRSERYSRVSYQWPKQLSAQPFDPISESIARQGLPATSEARVPCLCGCMESYRFQ
jgi:hypothetical protein